VKTVTNLTTEGRVFARQVIREIKRRAPLDASAFAGKPVAGWQEAILPWNDRLNDPTGPFTLYALAAAQRRLEAVLKEGSSFIREDVKDPRVRLHMLTLSGGDHTLMVMEGLEEAVYVQYQLIDLDLRCRRMQLILGCVVANVSEHALGRFRERATRPPTLANGINLVKLCGQVGEIAAIDPRLGHSEINFIFDGLLITGSMKIASPVNSTGFATAFFDCRTVLPEDAADAEQREQARILGWHLRGNYPEPVPVIPRRPDFVLDTLAAARRPKH
jgi:hypothetical protein